LFDGPEHAQKVGCTLDWMNQEAEGLDHAEHHENAGELAKEPGYVGLNRERFEIDNAQQELAIENAKLQR
jgi:hypothetical protein